MNYGLRHRLQPGTDVLLLNPDAMIEPTSGTIRLAGTDITNLTGNAMWPHRRHIQALSVLIGASHRAGGRYLLPAVPAPKVVCFPQGRPWDQPPTPARPRGRAHELRCRSGGTRILTGNTMIFSHRDGVLIMLETGSIGAF